MKKMLIILMVGVMTASGIVFADKQVPSKISVNRLVMKGEIIDDDNILFNLKFTAEAEEKGWLNLVSGKVCEKNSKVTEAGQFLKFWADDNFSIYSRQGLYFLEANDEGKCDISFDFFSRVVKRGDWRETSFGLLPAIARVVEIHSKRKDIELEIPGALKVIKKDADDGGAVFHAALPPEGLFSIKWRSHVDDLDAKLVVSVTPAVVAEALPGTVHITSVFNYKVIQGKLNSLDLKISDDLNILNVQGGDIQDWRVDKTADGRYLRVSLSREFDKDYKLVVKAEKVLPEFPCNFSLPKIVPEKVLRIDGYLAFGTNKAVKLIIGKTTGLNQIDIAAFPVKLAGTKMPTKSLYTYSFSGNEYSLETSADNIQPSYTVQLNHTVSFKDEDMIVKSYLAMDVKDAPLRELMVRYPVDFSVNRVEGRSVVTDDYEIVKKGKEKWLRIPFKKNTLGKVNVEINFEKNISDLKTLDIPTIFIDKAKSVRGELLLAAARGLSLKTSNLKNLRKFHPGSASMRIQGLQLSFKFKGQDWSGEVSLTHEKTSFVSEIFHLATVAEGEIYGMSIFNYRISGAPVDKIIIGFDKSLKNPEFTGGNIIDWKKVDEDETHNYWQVNFREKLYGDYKLLTTYETMLASKDDSQYRIGDIFTKNAEAESGFIAVSSKRNLEISQRALSEAVLDIEQTELPQVYRSMVQNPILKIYKFYQTPHWVDIGIKGYPNKKLIGTAVDYAMLNTRIDKNGEIVTDVEYRIKNTTEQFLSIYLPKNAELWNVKVDGNRKRVSESGNQKGHYLIPIPRKKDTDEPIAISISYAQKTEDALGAKIDIPLQAPKLDVDTMRITWNVDVPDNYDFISFEGNMHTKQSPRASGFSGFFSLFSLWTRVFVKTGLIYPFLLLSFLGALLSFSWGKKKLRIFLTIVCSLGILYGLYELIMDIRQCTRYEFSVPSVNSATFTKLFTIAANTPVINLHLENMEASSFIKILALILYMLLAAGLFKYAIQKKSSILAGLGSVMIIVGFSKWLSASMLMAVLLSSLIPLAIIITLWIIIFRKSRKSLLASMSALAILFTGFNTLEAGPPVVIEQTTYDITASNKEVKAIGHFVVKADEEGTILIVPAPAAITGEVPDDSGIKIERIKQNYYLKVKDAGTYEFDLQLLLPLKEEKNGIFGFPLPLPDSKRNLVNAKVNQKNFDLTTNNSVSFKSKTENGTVSVVATFVPGTKADFKLTPLKRKVEDEAVQFFATESAIAKFAGGFVEINYAVNFNIAQGEMSKFAFEVPDNMGITSVSVPNLGAWRYSPETDILEVFLTQPQRDILKMNITAQIANCSLPYQKEVAMLKIKGAGKQHGSLGIIADPNVQIEIEKTSGFSKINSDDFTHGSIKKVQNLKKAFRYFKIPAKVTIKAIPVEPEIRINERTVVSYEDEKTTLISDLAFEATKAGVFSATINVPKDFDIDKVTGPNIRHWDELSDKSGHRIIVHFERRMLGTTQIHLEMMTEKNPGKKTTIPRISVKNAQKHKGSLAVKLERGTRMDIIERRGLELVTSGFGRETSGTSQNFSIIRPDWVLKVSFEIAAPWIQAENLQIGKISNGSMSFNALFHYKIENAGVKHFKVKLPEGAEVPEFIGKNILTYEKMENGVWDIELKKKENSFYRLHVKFRLPFKNLKALVITPVKAVGIGLKKGYLAILTEDSIQVKPAETKGELNDFDARKIPSSFKETDLSNAVLCYRTVGTDYSVKLNLERHKAAELLRAEIKKLNIVSIVSEEGNVITKMLIDLKNIGNENLLSLELPAKSQLWSVFIDKLPQQNNPGQPVEAAEEKGRLLIPLKQKKGIQVIELVYSVPANSDWEVSDQVYTGPKFDLPLNNISWTLYLPEKYNYEDFSGSLEYNQERWIPVAPLSINKYDELNNRKQWRKKTIAKQWLTKANKEAKAGNIDVANDAFRNAANYALNDNELQEDVQGQWQNAQRGNVINLFQQRSADIPQAKNQTIQTVQAPQQLSGKERQTINIISDKIFKQQQAATNETKPLQFTIPENGTMLNFTRALQKDRNEPMKVVFEASPAVQLKTFNPFVAGFIMTILLGLFYKLTATAFKKEKEENEV